MDDIKLRTARGDSDLLVYRLGHLGDRDGGPMVIRGIAAAVASTLDGHLGDRHGLVTFDDVFFVRLVREALPELRSVGSGRERRLVVPTVGADAFAIEPATLLAGVIEEAAGGAYAWSLDAMRAIVEEYAGKEGDEEPDDEDGEKRGAGGKENKKKKEREKEREKEEATEDARSDPRYAFAKSVGDLASGLGGSNRIRGIRALLLDDIAVREERLDADPRLLGTPLGVMDRAAGRLLSEEGDASRFRDSIVTMSTTGLPPCEDTEGSAELVPDPRWAEFVMECCCGRRDLYDYLHRALGYACLGSGERDLALVLYGPTTRNGKTVLMDAVANAMGDYAWAAPPELVCASGRRRDSGSADESLASLRGRRLVTVSELPQGAVMDSAKVKAITGHSTISARGIYEHQTTFAFGGTLVLDTNYLPAVTDGTVFESGRVAVVPFDNHVPEERRDETLRARFANARGATTILWWLLDGYQEYLRDGLDGPPEVREATTRWRYGSNSALLFLREKCTLQDDATVGVGEFKGEYQAWCDAEGLAYLSTSALKGVLHDMGVREARTSSERLYRGVGIR